MQEKTINLLDILLVLLEHKKKILAHFVVVTIIAVVFSCVLTKIYKATVVFLPPNTGSGSGISALMQNFAVDILGGNEISKRQINTIIVSRELREEIIRKFDLIHVYKSDKSKKPLEDALKMLELNTKIDAEEEGGLGFSDVISYSITVFDKSPVRCADIANYYVDLINGKIKELNSSKAMGNRIFIEKQIEKNTIELENKRAVLKEFQLKNRVFNVSAQTQLVLQATADLRSQIINLEANRSYLLLQNQSSHPSITQIESRIQVLNGKISELEMARKPDLLPGLNISLDLANQYADLYIEVETLTNLISLLKQQYEQAKIQEAKDVASIRIIDRARPPQWKAKPKRAYVVLLIVFFYMSILLIFILLKQNYPSIKEANPIAFNKINRIYQQVRLFKK